MNDELSRDAQTLLAAARASFSPDSQRVATVRAALDVRIGAPGAQGSGSYLRGRSGSVVKGGATHVIAWGLVALALGGGVLALASRHGTARNPVPAVAGSPPIEPGVWVESPPTKASESTMAKADVPPPVAVSNLPIARPPRRPLRSKDEPPPAEPARLEPTPAPTPAPSPVDSDDSLAHEVSLLRNARTALDGGHAEQALTLVQRHAQLWPRGVLVEERLATQVFALCALGRVTEAAATAHELESLAPHSPHLARVRTSCAGSLGTAAP